MTRVAGGYQLDGVRKSYVTSAAQATHYQCRCRIGADTPQSNASLLFIERDKIDWQVLEPWQGLGMRGNQSSPMRFKSRLLGSRGTRHARPDDHLRGHCLCRSVAL